jgi:phosphatidate cytidylyltransferase
VTRLISGLLLIALVLAAVWLAPPWVFLTAVACVALGAFVEYAALAAQTGLDLPKVAGGAAAAVVAGAIGLHAPVVPVLAGVTIVCCVVVLGRHVPGPNVPGAAAATLFPVLYLGLPMGLLAATRVEFGREAVLFVLGLVIVSDTAQFYVGSTLGKRRLAPQVSPKKSVEGAVGGLVAAAAVSAAFGRVAWPTLGVGWLAAMGLVLGALGIAGDLFESLLKRSASVKDSSALIPGHGGILDRIDALLLVIPGFYLFLVFFH